MRFTFSAGVLVAVGCFASAADWPQWGGGPTRNAVSPEKGAPLDFHFDLTEEGTVGKAARGIAWSAPLGSNTMIPPVVADGLVWVGTNARDPEDDRLADKDWDGGVLMCFRESDGKLLWKHRSPRLSGEKDWSCEDPTISPLGSCPLVEGDRLWYLNRTEVVCFDIAPLKKKTGEPRELWKLDLRAKFGVFPVIPYLTCELGGLGASVAGYKDKLYVVTHNAVNWQTGKIPAPDAPSLVCLEKATGKVLWKDNSPGKNILASQTSSPLVVEIGGTVQAIVGQGDGWLRSFDAATGELIWKCDLNPKEAVWEVGGTGNRNSIVATPVFYDGKVYIPTGTHALQSGPANLYCIDPTRKGDVSRELDAGPMKGKPNPNSAVVWYTPWKVPKDAPLIKTRVMPRKDFLREYREYYYGGSLASVTAHDGLLYAGDSWGCVYCFDAKTGKLHWGEYARGAIRGQPLWVDGKVYVTADDGYILVFAHGKEKKLLAKIETPWRLRTGLVFANGTLYVTDPITLYAIRSPK